MELGHAVRTCSHSAHRHPATCCDGAAATTHSSCWCFLSHPQRHRQACCLEVHACIVAGVQRDAWRPSGVKLHAPRYTTGSRSQSTLRVGTAAEHKRAKDTNAKLHDDKSQAMSNSNPCKAACLPHSPHRSKSHLAWLSRHVLLALVADCQVHLPPQQLKLVATRHLRQHTTQGQQRAVLEVEVALHMHMLLVTQLQQECTIGLCRSSCST